MFFDKVLAAVAVAAAVSSASAQSSVTIVVREGFPDSTIAAVVESSDRRESGPVIAIRRSALSVDLLNAALGAIDALERRKSHTNFSRGRVSFRLGERFPKVPQAERRATEALLLRLQTANDFEEVRVRN